jgi:hypothetical protein
VLTRICRKNEQVDWSLKVSDSKMALDALHRSMRRYRKNRGNGIYRCSPMDAREVAVRYVALRSNQWGLSSSEVSDNALAIMLIIAFGLSVFFSQAAALGTGQTLGITATVLTALTIGMASTNRPECPLGPLAQTSCQFNIPSPLFHRKFEPQGPIDAIL